MNNDLWSRSGYHGVGLGVVGPSVELVPGNGNSGAEGFTQAYASADHMPGCPQTHQPCCRVSRRPLKAFRNI